LSLFSNFLSDMEPRDIIKAHFSLCEKVYDVLLEENSWLKLEKKAPELSFLDRKREIVNELDASLANLKKLKPEFFSPFDDTKKLVSDSHAKLLQIFYLDRENEELLIKYHQSSDRETFTRFTINPDQVGEFPGRD
jgi:hypothetical protein